MANPVFNNSKLRKSDVQLSDLISEFLDKYFYNDITTNFERVTEKSQQVIGIDTKFTINDTEYICDEKAAVHYINKPLKTFALELSYFNRISEEKIGWLLNDNNVNNSYMFIWIDKAETNKPITIEEILDVEFALVKKDKIVTYLESLGWTMDKLLKKGNMIRESNDEYMGDVNKDGFKFSKSMYLVEKPINILLPRKILIEIADYTNHIIL